MIKELYIIGLFIGAAKAAIHYDEAIQYQANKGKDLVQSEVLDELYFDWLSKTKTALERAKDEGFL